MAAARIFINALMLASFAGALYFAAAPVAEHKLFHDYMSAKAGIVAAERGFESVASERLGSVKNGEYKSLLAANIAFFKTQKDNPAPAETFEKNGELKAERLAQNILNEGGLGASGIKIKYMPEIERLKSPISKAYCLYALSVKTKDPSVADFVFKNLHKLRSPGYGQKVLPKLINLAVSNSRSRDLAAFANVSKTSYAANLAALKYIENGELLSEIGASEKKNLFPFCASAYAFQNAAKKNYPEEKLAAPFLFYAAHFGSWGQYDCKELSYPVLAYMSKIINDENLYDKYKSLFASCGVVDKLSGSRYKVLKYAATIFAASGDWRFAMELAASSKSAFDELKILSAIADYFPKDEAAVRALCERVKLLSDKKFELGKIY